MDEQDFHGLSDEAVAELTQFQERTLLESDARVINKACQGFGTSDSVLISAICTRTKAQLASIDETYHRLFGVTLAKLIESECSGNYKEFLLACVTPSDVYDLRLLDRATKGVGNDKLLLNELFIGRLPEELEALKRKVAARGGSLVDLMKSELSGDVEKLVVNLVQKPRPEGTTTDPAAALADAKALNKAAKGWGTDEGKFIEIFSSRSRKQMQAIKAAYEKEYNTSLLHMAKDELNGSFEDAIVALLYDSKESFLASRLRAAMEGLGTDDEVVVRILGGQDKNVVKGISRAYFDMYNRRLKDDLKSEMSGDVRRAVITWMESNDPFGAAVCSPLRGVELASALSRAVAERTADEIFFACRGIGTDESALIDILCSRNKSQLRLTDLSFREKYGKSLVSLIESECSGDFKRVLKYIAMPEHVFDVYLLTKACKGMGTDEQLLIDVLASSSNDRLFAAKTYFEKCKGKALVDVLRSELSGDFENIILGLVRCERSESKSIDEGQAEQWLQKLVGTSDSATVIDVITSASPAQIGVLAQRFEAATNSSLTQAIKDRCSGDVERIMLALAQDPIDYLCQRFHDAFAGLGTNDNLVCMLIGGRDKPDIKAVAQRYLEKYDVRLVDALKSELSGNFERACMAWVNDSDYTNGLDLLAVTQTDPASDLVAEIVQQAENDTEGAASEPAAPRDPPSPPFVPPPKPAPVQELNLLRESEGRVSHRWGPARSQENWPAMAYLSAPVTARLRGVAATITALDQGWGNSNISRVDLVLYRPGTSSLALRSVAEPGSVQDGVFGGPQGAEHIRTAILSTFGPASEFHNLPEANSVKAVARIAVVNHDVTEYTIQLGGESEIVREAQPGDIVEVMLVSAPYPGWQCRALGARITLLS
eukprot:c38865_g1_i1.p1 GENE.c38865_g1_i1~~c38865_g1_i1.p1  ORF type:complete len:898 (+),score=245.06 c38865_g1_i1:40-2694(+)